MRLILVRHCQSAVDPSSPAHTWGLTDQGHDQANRLVQMVDLEPLGTLACGPEPKMTQTLEPIAQASGLSTVVDDRFRETDSVGWMLQAEFDATVRRLFDHLNEPPAPGWETARAAGERMAAGVEGLLPGSCGGDIAVCSGGRALTSLLVTMGLIAEGESFEYWRSILMPDLARIDVDMGGLSDVLSVASHFGTSPV